MESSSSSVSFAVAINVFDDTIELLESVIQNLVMNKMDTIIVLWQKVSYHGEPSRISNWPHRLQEIKSRNHFHFLDECFHPTLMTTRGSISIAAQNEVAKRNLGLQIAKRLGQTYFMSLDADEYFLPEEMNQAKSYLQANPEIDATISTYCYYYKTFQYVMKQRRNIWIPLFYKIKPTSRFAINGPRPRLTDPTRVVVPASKWHIFEPKTLICHHAAYIRSVETMSLKCHHRTNRNAHSEAHTMQALKAFKEFRPEKDENKMKQIHLLAWNGPTTLIRISNPICSTSLGDSILFQQQSTPEEIVRLVESFYYPNKQKQPKRQEEKKRTNPGANGKNKKKPAAVIKQKQNYWNGSLVVYNKK
jgi:hypothetical protein